MADATWIASTAPIRHERGKLKVCPWCLLGRLVLLLSAAVGSGIVALGVGVWL